MSREYPDQSAGLLRSAKYRSAKALLSPPKQSFRTPDRRERNSPAVNGGTLTEERHVSSPRLRGDKGGCA